MACEFCSDGTKAIIGRTTDFTVNMNVTDTGVRTIEIECTPCPKLLSPHFSAPQCGLYNVPSRTAILINFCPYCGRDLRKD